MDAAAAAPCYVVVYVGYEGIDYILWAGTDPGEAVGQVQRFRSQASRTAALSEEDRWALPSPAHWIVDPDRVCAMSPGESCYECCCKTLGVEPERSVLY